MIKKTTIESASLSFARIKGILTTAKDLGKEEPYRKFIMAVLKDLSDKSTSCNFGLLWNAWTEKRDADILMKLTHPENPVVIHADSGGLQEITLGIQYTKEDKTAIYERQGRWSTHAMSFDKMPIIVDYEQGGSSVDMSNRYFVKELIYEAGRESGLNVLEQCRVISEIPKEERKAKILVIIQGNTFEDYKEYAKGLFSVFDDLDKETKELYYKQIGGLSMGMSGTGNYFNLIDLILRSPVDFDMIPEELRNEIHFLGVGGITRVAPFFAIDDNFYGDRDIHFTFDSTSRTSSSTYGKFTKLEPKEDGGYRKKTLTTGRVYNKKVKDHLEDVYFENKINIEKYLTDRNIKCYEDFKEELSSYRSDGHRLFNDMIKGGMTEPEARNIRLGSTLVSDFLHWVTELIKFFKMLDMYESGDFSLLSKKEFERAVVFIKGIKNYDEYMLPKNREFLRLILEPIKMSEINIVDKVEDINKNKHKLNIDDEEW